jgi:RHS repeat-associated protein
VIVNGTSRTERLYLDGAELYREYAGASLDKRRETLRVIDADHAVAEIDTLTVESGAGVTPASAFRYQLDNHLRSSTFELDDDAEIIAYEEFYPYGSTSFEISNVDLPARRYRYTGMERDEETGLQRHGVRYYAAWLGRWVSADPKGLGDGVNLFRYAHSQPVRLADVSGESATDLDAAVTQLREQARSAFNSARDAIQVAARAQAAEGPNNTVIENWIDPVTGQRFASTLAAREQALPIVQRSEQALRQLESQLRQRMVDAIREQMPPPALSTTTGNVRVGQNNLPAAIQNAENAALQTVADTARGTADDIATRVPQLVTARQDIERGGIARRVIAQALERAGGGGSDVPQRGRGPLQRVLNQLAESEGRFFRAAMRTMGRIAGPAAVAGEVL